MLRRCCAGRSTEQEATRLAMAESLEAILFAS